MFNKESNKVLENVTVADLSKFGIIDQEGRYVNWSPTLDNAVKVPVVKGRTFQMELYISPSGKRYINKVLQQVEEALPKVAKAVKATPVMPTTPSGVMTKAEWNAKDRSQLIGGLSHDAATLVAAMLSTTPDVNVQTVITMFEQVLQGLLKVRDGLK